MDEEKEKKEIDEKAEQEPAKSVDELIGSVGEISDEVLLSPEGGTFMKALYREQAYKSRKLEGELSILKEQNKELEKKIVVYEERMGWKNFMGIISSVLVGISFILIQTGISYWIALALIIVVIVINVLPFPWFLIKLFSRKKSEKI